MLEILLKLVILFFVIFDPLASFAVFLTASASMSKAERRETAMLAIFVAAVLSFSVLILGENLLWIFNTTIDEFRVAGGIILGILGIKMSLGLPLAHLGEMKNDSRKAIAAIIGTPLLTGPAVITATIVTVKDYGPEITGLAIAIVLFSIGILFIQAERLKKILGTTTIQVLSTILGLVTLSWGIKFITTGLKAIIGG